MLTALEICAALTSMVIMLTAATVLAAFELGRLATRDDEQHQFDAADVARIPNDARRGSPRRAMRGATALALIAVLGPFGTMPPAHAEAPHECRSQCSIDLDNCRDGCVESGGFNGCEEECGWVYEYCANDCRLARTSRDNANATATIGGPRSPSSSMPPKALCRHDDGGQTRSCCE